MTQSKVEYPIDYPYAYVLYTALVIYTIVYNP